MVWDGVLIFIALITAVVVWLRWNFGHWKKKGIPYVEPTVLFGNIKDAMVGNINMGVISQRIYNAFPNEPVVGMFRMRSPVLQVRDPELIKAILIGEFNSFRNNGLSISKDADPILGRNPFFLKDDEWKDTRKVQTHQHSASKLKTLYGYVEEVKDELIEYLNDNLGRKFEAGEFCARFTTDIVSSCVFGIKTSSHTDSSSEFRKRSENILDNSWRIMLWQMAPKLVERMKIRILDQKNNDYFYNLVKSVVDMRREKNVSRADFIQNLINDKTSNLSLIDMTAQTMTFFIDGYATSATEMSFMLYMLAIHPEVQERLREEIKSKKLDFDTLHHLPYMDAVFNETLRLYPAGTFLNRECNQDTTITVDGRKYEFKVGDIIEIPVYAIQRDSAHFENPLHFDPDRFLNEPNHPALFTFGAGPRACLGSRFAKTQIKAGIAALVQNFKIVPGTNDWSLPTVNNNKSILISPDSEMSVKFEKL